MKSTLATETGGNNPGLRLIKYTASGQIVDFDQFYLNLTDIIGGGEPQWKLAYSMKDHFELESLSVENVADHVQQVNNKQFLTLKY